MLFIWKKKCTPESRKKLNGITYSPLCQDKARSHVTHLSYLYNSKFIWPPLTYKACQWIFYNYGGLVFNWMAPIVTFHQNITPFLMYQTTESLLFQCLFTKDRVPTTLKFSAKHFYNFNVIAFTYKTAPFMLILWSKQPL